MLSRKSLFPAFPFLLPLPATAGAGVNRARLFTAPAPIDIKDWI